jgi:hypothetical protein
MSKKVLYIPKHLIILSEELQKKIVKKDTLLWRLRNIFKG